MTIYQVRGTGAIDRPGDIRSLIELPNGHHLINEKGTKVPIQVDGNKVTILVAEATGPRLENVRTYYLPETYEKGHSDYVNIKGLKDEGVVDITIIPKESGNPVLDFMGQGDEWSTMVERHPNEAAARRRGKE